MMLNYAKMVVYVVMMVLNGATNAFVYLDFMVITVRYVSRTQYSDPSYKPSNFGTYYIRHFIEITSQIY